MSRVAGSTNMPDLRTRLTLDTSQFSAGLTEARGQAAMFGSAIGMVGAGFGTAATAMATFATIGVLTAGVFVTAFVGAAAAVMSLGVISAAQSEQVKTAWTLTAQFIQRGMLAAANAYIPILTQLAQNVETAFTQVQASLTQVFEQLAPVFGQLANGFLGELVGILNGLPNLVNRTLAIVQQVGPAFEQMLSSVSAGWNQLVNAFLQFGGTILQGALPGIGQFFGALMSGLSTVLAAAAQLAGPVFSTLGAVAAGLAHTFGGLVTALMPLFLAIGQVLPQLAPVLVALGQLLVGMVGGFVKGLAPLLAMFSNPSWSAGLVQGIQQITPPLVALATAFGSFISFVVQGFGLIIGGLGSLFGAFSSIVPGLSGIGSAGGKALMVGLIAGIGFMIDPLLGIVGGVIAAIAAFLPHSPAQTGPLSGDGSPKARGQALGRDFAAGISSQTGAVTTAASQLASAASGVNAATNSPLSGTSGGAGGLLSGWLANIGLGAQSAGNIIVNVAGSILSQNELMDTIQTASLRKQNRNAGSVLATSVRGNV